MKWIKASERLPVKKKFYNCRFEGCPVIYWIDGENIVLNGEVMDKSIWRKIEWLDESEPYPGEDVQRMAGMSVGSLFQSLNGGKEVKTSVQHGETFTAQYVVDFALRYAAAHPSN